MADASRSSQAEERVRVLEQYIRDMSIRNMQRIQTSETEKAGPAKKEDDKREEALEQQEAELAARERDMATREDALEKGLALAREERRETEDKVARMTSALLTQGHELASARSELEKLRRDHWVVTEQLSSGSRRLAHYASRYLSENAKVWDLTASTTSTASTVSSLSHMSTGSGDSNPVAECSQGLDGTLLRADDSTDYSTFPSEATLACDPCEYLRKLRSDLKRLGLVESQQLKPASVLALGASGWASATHLANEPACGWAENPELHERIEEVWRGVEERIGRVEGGLRSLYAQLELLSMDLPRTDPSLLMRSVSEALLQLLSELSYVPPSVKEVLDSVRQLSDDLAPVAKRIRLAESGFKVKEQRHALKVDLLEKRLQRLTGTLTTVQQASRRSSSSSPEEPQTDPTRAQTESLEEQVVELTLGKFDAEKAVEQLRQEERHWADRKLTARAPPAPVDRTEHSNPFEGLGVFSAPAFALGPEWSLPGMHTSTSPCMFYPPPDPTV